MSRCSHIPGVFDRVVYIYICSKVFKYGCKVVVYFSLCLHVTVRLKEPISCINVHLHISFLTVSFLLKSHFGDGGTRLHSGGFGIK